MFGAVLGTHLAVDAERKCRITTSGSSCPRPPSPPPPTTTRTSGTVIYVTNVAVADLLYVLTLPPLIVSNAMAGDAWPFGDGACKLVRFLFMLNLHCSVTFLACVSVYRVLGVRFPVSPLPLRLRSRRAAVALSVSVWALVTAELLPTLLYSHTGRVGNVTVCFDMADPRRYVLYFPYGIFLCAVGFFVPFAVIACSYGCLIKTLYCARGPGTAAGKRRNRSLRTGSLAAVCAQVVLCFVPYHVVRTVYLFVRVYAARDCRDANAAMLSLDVWKPLVSLNCCANPLVYFLGSRRYRDTLRRWLCRRRRATVRPTVSLVEVTAAASSQQQQQQVTAMA
ncbi:hypothetical protein CRUP_027688 [Coryphaenoides rupestris]|nr:hypothetical protein CRUP_027688 [Coryphaenoides rupestris]